MKFPEVYDFEYVSEFQHWFASIENEWTDVLIPSVDAEQFPKQHLQFLKYADDILMKRESGNDIMDLFLNLSDGIVSNKEKKFIFTSNLPNLNSIDDALLRNGRCFATIEFKTLTEEQGKTIAEDLNIEYNSSIECLADAFAIKNILLNSQLPVTI